MGTKSKKDVGAIVRRSGVSFRVWAPFAEQVSLTGSFNDWTETPMENEQDGYWWVFVPHAKAGQEYKYVIKNGSNTFKKNISCEFVAFGQAVGSFPRVSGEERVLCQPRVLEEATVFRRPAVCHVVSGCLRTNEIFTIDFAPLNPYFHGTTSRTGVPFWFGNVSP